MKTEDLRKQYCNESKEKYIEFASLEELQHYVEWLESKLTSIKNEREKLAKVQSVLVNRMKSSKIKPSSNKIAREILWKHTGDEEEIDYLRHVIVHAMEEYASQKDERLREALEKVRSAYPYDVFPKNGKSIDCKCAEMARITCDNIEREYNEEAKALHIGGVSNRYQVTDIKLADWESVVIGDTETNKVVCHFITENGFDEAVEMAKNITKYLNGC